MSTTTLEIVTPERLVLSEAVELVVVPGADGDLGVRPRHAPTIATLRDGVVRVFAKGLSAGETARYQVSGGFVDVTPDSCRVLCESAEAV